MKNYEECSREELNQMMIDEVERAEHQEWLDKHSLKKFETTSYGADKYLIEHQSKEFLYEITVHEKEVTGTKYLNIRDTDGTVLDNDILDMNVREVESILTVIEDKELGRNNFTEVKRKNDQHHNRDCKVRLLQRG